MSLYLSNSVNLCFELIDWEETDFHMWSFLVEIFHNIFHGRLDFPQAEFFEATVERNLRGHDFKIRHRSFRLLRRKAA